MDAPYLFSNVHCNSGTSRPCCKENEEAIRVVLCKEPDLIVRHWLLGYDLLGSLVMWQCLTYPTLSISLYRHTFLHLSTRETHDAVSKPNWQTNSTLILNCFEVPRGARCHIEWKIHLGTMRPKVDATSWSPPEDLPLTEQLIYLYRVHGSWTVIT